MEMSSNLQADVTDEQKTRFHRRVVHLGNEALERKKRWSSLTNVAAELKSKCHSISFSPSSSPCRLKLDVEEERTKLIADRFISHA